MILDDPDSGLSYAGEEKFCLMITWLQNSNRPPKSLGFRRQSHISEFFVFGTNGFIEIMGSGGGTEKRCAVEQCNLC